VRIFLKMTRSVRSYTWS